MKTTVAEIYTYKALLDKTLKLPAVWIFILPSAGLNIMYSEEEKNRNAQSPFEVFVQL